jgi:hypothetical protein
VATITLRRSAQRNDLQAEDLHALMRHFSQVEAACEERDHLIQGPATDRRGTRPPRTALKQAHHGFNRFGAHDCEEPALFEDRKLRMLTVVDLFIREHLTIEVGLSRKVEDFVRTLRGVPAQQGMPRAIKTDSPVRRAAHLPHLLVLFHHLGKSLAW